MLDVVNPATEERYASVPHSNATDCVKAIEAARRAFASWSVTSAAERANFIIAAADELTLRADELADVITATMGCPRHICPGLQVN